jgi:YVTN family beta-propeller protein
LKVLDRSAQIADAGCTKHCTPTVLPPVRIDFDYDWPGAEVHRAGLEHYTSDRSLAEPAGAPSVLTVGAFCVRTGELEPFSSRGPTPDGRIKPDLVAPDGDILSTPVFNYDGTCQTAGFRGTSAAAADAAAVAATVKSAMPEATPAELKTFLTERADDAGPAGTDSTWGAGRIRLRAFGDVPSSAAYAGASEELFRRKILRPRAGGKLEPAASVTRAEMAEYILRALGHADHLPPYRGYYSDLSATDPRTPWVEHLREHGIADVTSGAYRPDDPITHAEATGFLGRAAPGAELPPDNDPAAPLTRAELTLWIAAAWDMRWFKHLQGLVDDSVIVGDRVWFTDEAANTVNSYNFLTGKLEAPVTVGSKPREIDATPDGTKLVVTNLGSYDVSVIDTGSRSELRRVAIPRGNLGETPRSIATAADGSALVATTTLYYSGYTSHIYSLDPDTGAVRLREDLPAFADFGTTTEVTYVSPSLDHSRIFAVEGNSSAGNVWAYDSATDSRVGVAGMGDFVGYVAADREGDTVVVGPDLTLSRGDATVDHPIATSSGFGTAVSPGGTRLFTAGAGGLRVYDLASDGLLATLPLGDSVRDALSRTYIYTPVTRSAMDPAGRIVAVVTDGGLTLMPTGLDPSEPNLLPTDRDAPTVAIASGPSGSTTATSATFTFASGDPAARFQCSRDGQPLGACPNPVTFSALAEGPHELVVRAVDRAGNPSPKISRAWMVGTSENQPPPPDPPPSAPPPADEPAPVPVPAPTNEPAPPPPAGGAPVAPQPAVPADSSPAERGSMPSAALRPRAVRRPRIRGSLAVGRRATAYVGVWSGTPPLRIDVRWQRCDRNGHHCRTVARGRRYRIRAVNRARALRLVVSVRGPGGAATATAPARRVS